MESASRVFVDAQNPDGTLDAGNLASPPDTGFVVEGLAASLGVLRRMDEPGLRQTKDTLTKFLLAAGEALVTGGIHTPNHRWVVCCALARINALFPAARYVNRIDDWLGEGIYQDPDGQFEERSTGIYSRVTDNAFLTISRLLNRPATAGAGSQESGNEPVLPASGRRTGDCCLQAAGSEHGGLGRQLLHPVSISGDP